MISHIVWVRPKVRTWTNRKEDSVPEFNNPAFPQDQSSYKWIFKSWSLPDVFKSPREAVSFALLESEVPGTGASRETFFGSGWEGWTTGRMTGNEGLVRWGICSFRASSLPSTSAHSTQGWRVSRKLGPLSSSEHRGSHITFHIYHLLLPLFATVWLHFPLGVLRFSFLCFLIFCFSPSPFNIIISSVFLTWYALVCSFSIDIIYKEDPHFKKLLQE